MHWPLRAHPLAFSLALLLGGRACAAAQSAACPDLSGHYRVNAPGPTQGDALAALNAQPAGFTDSELRLTRQGAESLQLWIKSGSSGRMPALPSRVLRAGSDFRCEDGWLVLLKPVNAERRLEQGWVEGQARLQLARAPRGGLSLQLRLSGSQRSTLYAYESARISVPKLGTGVRWVETIRWPDLSEPLPVEARHTPEPEAPALAKVRQRLNAGLLGNVMLAGLSPKGEAVRVTLKALRTQDIPALEDRLRAASIAYEMPRPPIWTNGAHHLELLLWPAGQAPQGAGRPSAHRVQQELERVRAPLVDVHQVLNEGSGYQATLYLLGPERADSIVARIRLNSGMFKDIAVLGEAPHPGAPRLRVLRLALTLH